MARNAMLPCFTCGTTLTNIDAGEQNQPYEGTEFRTYGHYGSTMWDSFDGEELVLNICDVCLRRNLDRLAQHKRYLPVRCSGMTGFGRQWVDRPMVPYSGHADHTHAHVSPEELGAAMSGVEWVEDIGERRQALLDT